MDMKILGESRKPRDIDVVRTEIEHTQRRIATYRLRWWGILIALLIGGGLGYIIRIAMNFDDNNIQTIIASILIGIIACLLAYMGFFFSLATVKNGKLRKLEIELAQSGVVEARSDMQTDFFTKLVDLNFKYLDEYYLQTKEQADKSFKLTSIASAIGLLIIIIGIIMMFLGKTTPAYITSGAGIISEFIAAVFFYLYNRTVLKMSQYHQKLVATQNISLALKITEDMKDKDTAKALIIDRLTTDINSFLTGSAQ